jgi:hypothetical protein
MYQIVHRLKVGIYSKRRQGTCRWSFWCFWDKSSGAVGLRQAQSATVEKPQPLDLESRETLASLLPELMTKRSNSSNLSNWRSRQSTYQKSNQPPLQTPKIPQPIYQTFDVREH